MWLYVYSVPVTSGAHTKEKQIHGKCNTSREVEKGTKCWSEYPK